MASKSEREKRSQSNYDALTSREKKYFKGTITKSRRSKGASARQLEDRLEQEKMLKREAGVRRGKG